MARSLSRSCCPMANQEMRLSCERKMDNTPRMKGISVIVNTLNEERHLPDCLQSLKWAQEIIVVDMHSEDRTREIAESFGCRFFLHERKGYVEPARNFAIQQARCDWVLVVDADERVSEGLSKWLISELATTTASAFRIPRRNHYGDLWMRHCGWFPDSQLRLFSRDKATYSDRIHRAPAIEGQIADLAASGEAYLTHRCFDNLESRFAKDNQYSTIAAMALSKEGRAVGALGILGRTIAATARAFFIQGGWRGGSLGVVLALERGTEAYFKYAKLWEANRMVVKPIPSSPVIQKRQTGRKLAD